MSSVNWAGHQPIDPCNCPRVSESSMADGQAQVSPSLFVAEPVRRRGRGPEVRLSRLPAASLPRVPAHPSPVASSPWWCRACAVPIARFLRAAARLRPLLIYLVLPSGRPPLYAADESCSDRRWLLALCCVARYYFSRLSRRVGGGAHRASEDSWSSWTSSTSWSS